MRATSFK